MIKKRMQMIFTDLEMNRLKIDEVNGQNKHIVADVHGMSRCQAERFINNIINVARDAFELTIIHGYKHGTVIKDMLEKSFYNDHIVEKYVDYRNQGVTHLRIV